MAVAAVQGISVVARFRPLNSLERSSSSKERLCAEFDDEHASIVRYTSETSSNTFAFDRVFSPASTQREVYEQSTARNLVAECFEGYNATVLAYGQTGSGKTWTMMGDRSESATSGIIPRMVDDVFRLIAAASECYEFTVQVSFVEIYNEMVRDLLIAPDDEAAVKKSLRVRESKTNGVWIEGASEFYTASTDEIVALMARGSANRSIGATRMNADSSRSHSVFIMRITKRDLSSGATTVAGLRLVDLAGSEMVKKTAATGERLKEAQNINLSLSALGNVIKALTSGDKHVPYRNSKLTRILADSLGGNSKTLLIVTASPSTYNAMETLSTCRFGERAKRIVNSARVNRTLTLEECKLMLKQTRARLKTSEALVASLTLAASEAPLAGPLAAPAAQTSAARTVGCGRPGRANDNSDDAAPPRRLPSSNASPTTSAPVNAPRGDLRDAVLLMIAERKSGLRAKVNVALARHAGREEVLWTAVAKRRRAFARLRLSTAEKVEGVDVVAATMLLGEVRSAAKDAVASAPEATAAVTATAAAAATAEAAAAPAIRLLPSAAAEKDGKGAAAPVPPRSPDSAATPPLDDGAGSAISDAGTLPAASAHDAFSDSLEDDSCELELDDFALFSDEESDEEESVVSVAMPPFDGVDDVVVEALECTEMSSGTNATALLLDVRRRKRGSDVEALGILDVRTGIVVLIARGDVVSAGAMCCGLRGVGDMHAAVSWWRTESARRRKCSEEEEESSRAAQKRWLSPLASSVGSAYRAALGRLRGDSSSPDQLRVRRKSIVGASASAGAGSGSGTSSPPPLTRERRGSIRLKNLVQRIRGGAARAPLSPSSQPQPPPPPSSPPPPPPPPLPPQYEDAL